MPIVEESGLMKYKDAAGNTTIMYPITTMENVDGVEEALAEVKTYTMVSKSIDPDSMYALIQAGKIPAVIHDNHLYVFGADYSEAEGTLAFFAITSATSISYLLYDLNAGTFGNATITNMARDYVATTSMKGLMSGSDKSKLDGIASGANKTTVDTAMSTTSTNPVQNKVVAAAIDAAIQSAIQNTWEASY